MTPNQENTEALLLLFADSKHAGKRAIENTEKRKQTGRKGRGNRKRKRKEHIHSSFWEIF